MRLFIECITINLLLTICVWIGTKDDKTKLRSFYSYPKEVQARILTISKYRNQIPKESKKLTTFLYSAIIFFVIFIVCCFLNNVSSFWDAFVTSIILGVVMNLYDLIILDILWFPNSNRTKITGTEDMIKEYHNLKLHIEAFFRGLILTLILALLIGCIFTLL